jgi:hypothetical protein
VKEKWLKAIDQLADLEAAKCISKGRETAWLLVG